MTTQILVLQGGEDVNERKNSSLMESTADTSRLKKVLVIPWTGNNDEKEAKYRSIFQKYFIDSGFREVLFLEKEDTERVTDKKLDSVDTIYLPGGKTDILYEELNKRSLQKRLQAFNGVLVGNSAGAIVLSRGATTKGRFYPGFGLIDLFISVHYKLGEPSVPGVDVRSTVNIPENMWITLTREG